MIEMNPLFAIGAALFPDLVSLAVGERGQAVIDKVASAIQGVTKSDAADVAQKAIDADPKVKADLQIALAKIALDERSLELKGEADRRADEIRKLIIELDNTNKSRDLIQNLTTLRSPIAWTPSLLSFIIVIMFFILLNNLLSNQSTILDPVKNQGVFQLVNIMFGAVAAGFTTVIGFWLGSSSGSKAKDLTLAQVATGADGEQASSNHNGAGGAGGGVAAGGGAGAGAAQPEKPRSVAGGTFNAEYGVVFTSLVPNGFYSSDPHYDPNRFVHRSVRCNNPGALNRSKWQLGRPGFVGLSEPDQSADHNVTTIYRSPEHGVAAWYHLLKSVYGLGNAFGLPDLARRYAGTDDPSKVENYIGGWCAKGGFAPTATFDIDDTVSILPLAKAMFAFEASKPTPLSDEQILFGIKAEMTGTLPA